MVTNSLTKVTNPGNLKLPVAWRGLFLTLSSSKFPEEKADIWYRESTESQYGHKPAWTNILASLLIMDPYIDSNSSSLEFKPRLRLLQPGVQERFLKFFIHQSHLVPDEEIVNFVRRLASHIARDSHLYHLLRELLKMTKGAVTMEDELFPQISDAKLAALGLGTDVACISVTADVISGNVGKPHTPVTEEREGSDIADSTTVEVIVLDDEDDDLHNEPIAKRQKLDLDTTEYTDNAKKVTNIDTSTAVTQDISTSESNIYPEMKDIEEKPIDKFICFSQQKEDVLTQLKDIWQNRVTQPDPALLQTLASFSSEEMKSACIRLDLKNMTEPSIATACEHLATVSDSISYNSSSFFLTYTLFVKVKELTHNASQILKGVVTLIAESFPKPLIDSVFVPIVTNSPTIPQCELICRVIKDTMSSASRNYFIQKIVELHFHTTDSEIIVLQSLIDSPSELTDTVLLKLLTIMETSSSELSRNIKFGKLLLGIVNKHGKVLSSGTVAKLANIVDGHGTFMKKSIEASLKKLKF